MAYQDDEDAPATFAQGLRRGLTTTASGAVRGAQRLMRRLAERPLALPRRRARTTMRTHATTARISVVKRFVYWTADGKRPLDAVHRDRGGAFGVRKK